MGLFDRPTMQNTYTPQWSTNYYQPTSQAGDWRGSLTQNWQTPQVGAVQTPFSAGQAYQNIFGYAPTQTIYSGAEGSAADALRRMIEGGGYTPEQKQTMFSGAAAPVLAQEQRGLEQTKGDVYARGMGQSTILEAAQQPIREATQRTLGGIAGDIERSGAERQMQAIQTAQAGSGMLQSLGIDRAQIATGIENMRRQADELNAELGMRRNELNAQLGVRARELELDVANLYQRQYATEQDRMLAEMELINRFNIDRATLDLAKETLRLQNEQENKNRTANFFANLFGSAATVAGAALGGV